MAKKQVNARTARYGSVDPYQQSWSGLEATVFAQDEVSFMTLGEIRREYGVYIENVYRGLSGERKVEKLHDELMIVPGMTLAVWGDWRALKKYSVAKLQTKHNTPSVIPVYCGSMPKKSRYIKNFLKDLGINPPEAHTLETYGEDSPEDVGFYINGTFFNYAGIRANEAELKKTLTMHKNVRDTMVLH